MERNKNLTPLSQTLRKNQTKEESLLWNAFLKKYPLQFRRQYVIGEYIADFYCHKAKLIIELDGSGHYAPEQQQIDLERTKLSGVSWAESSAFYKFRGNQTV